MRSPLGHSRCCLCRSRGLHVSTFLPPFPRPGLCCPCLSRLAPHRSYEGSVSWRARTHPPGLSASFALPSEHPAPNHDVGLDIALSVTSAHRVRPHAANCSRRETLGFANMRQARRTTPPKRVRHPAGCSFASDCSPPRLTATQLSSATQAVTSCGLDFHQPDNATSRTHRNTASPIAPYD